MNILKVPQHLVPLPEIQNSLTLRYVELWMSGLRYELTVRHNHTPITLDDQ